MPELEPGSFRDRNGRVFYRDNRVFRTLSAESLANWKILEKKRFFVEALDQGSIVGTRLAGVCDLPPEISSGNWAAILEHQKIPFISYPYEWSFDMLKDAALLQLNLLHKALQEEMILKDASSFNIQWRGARPVFIDIPSFERLRKGQIWVGYRQFCRLFLYPLLLQAYKNVPFQPWLRGSVDGIAPEHCNAFMSRRDRLRSGVLTHVYLQARLQARYGATRENIRGQLKGAGFRKELILHNVKALQKLVGSLKWEPRRSEWSDYGCRDSYSEEDRKAKTDFVRQVAAQRHWPLVWDLGCNVGRFSRIAAENAASVVALDGDHLTINRLYRELKSGNNQTILPLIFNLADPSPSLGWRCLERRGLLDRGRPDLTLCLALIHHLVISANIPLDEILSWLGSLGGDLVIEFVTKQDPMVETLLRNKDDQYREYELECFERCLGQEFELLKRTTLRSRTRVLYHARSRKQV
ncbi:MAG: methyltransferase [Acidobacteriota bacterium]